MMKMYIYMLEKALKSEYFSHAMLLKESYNSSQGTMFTMPEEEVRFCSSLGSITKESFHGV